MTPNIPSNPESSSDDWWLAFLSDPDFDPEKHLSINLDTLVADVFDQTIISGTAISAQQEVSQNPLHSHELQQLSADNPPASSLLYSSRNQDQIKDTEDETTPSQLTEFPHPSNPALPLQSNAPSNDDWMLIEGPPTTQPIDTNKETASGQADDPAQSLQPEDRSMSKEGKVLPMQAPKKERKRKHPEECHPSKRAAYYAAYKQAHKDEIAARSAAYYQARKDEIAARNAAYHQAHKDEIAARDAAYYQAHKDEIAARNASRRKKAKLS